MLSAVAVAAAFAVVPAAQATKFGSFADRFGKGPGPTNGGFTTGPTTTYTSTAKCTASAYTKNFSASKDAHTVAGVLPPLSHSLLPFRASSCVEHGSGGYSKASYNVAELC